MKNSEQSIQQHRIPKLIARIFGPALFIVTGAAWAGPYNLLDLATLTQGTTVVVRGPNVIGNAVGLGRPLRSAGASAGRRGIVFDHGALRVIDGLPGSDYTTVFGINDAGVVVGGSNTATAVRAFVNRPAGGTRELRALPGDIASTAFAVNNLGVASGFSSGPAGERAVIWAADGTVTTLPGTAGIVTRAVGINDRKDLVGAVDHGAGRRAVMWPRGGPPQELALLAGHVTGEALAVNASGATVGYSADSSDRRRAALWTASDAVASLGTLPGGDFSEAFGINDAGHVVGTSSSSSGNRAFLWTPGAGMRDLNELIVPSPVILTKAVGINNVGMIIALGHDASPAADGDAVHEDHEAPVRVFLLTPTGAMP